MNHDQREALRLAGIVADYAGKLVGEDLNFRFPPCSIMDAQPTLRLLKDAVRNYNMFILEMASKNN